MKFKRLEPGIYQSIDGRFYIRKVVSRQTYRPDEIVWEVSDNGKQIGFCYDTLREAKENAERVANGQRPNQ